MSDRLLDFTQTPMGKQIAGLLGVPTPPKLRRAKSGYAAQPLEGRSVVLGSATDGELSPALASALHEMGATILVSTELPGLAPVKKAAAAAKVPLKTEAQGEGAYAYVFDASGMEGTAGLRQLYDFLQPRLSRLAPNGRVLILSRAAENTASVAAYTASTALRGFIKSLGKEIGKKGATANLIEVGAGAEPTIAGALRFLLTEHSAFVDAQFLALSKPAKGAELDRFVSPLAGKVAIVTGAARGIGAAIAETLAREGASVVGIDRPAEEGALGLTMSRIGGRGLALDVTAADAGERLAKEIGGLDIVIHNAGVTRDKMLRNMPAHWWDQVLEINLGAILRINDSLFTNGLNPGARIVCISSIGGISGNAGQTNYGATKAGIIGYVEKLAGQMAKSGGAINAIAPGYIETQMTAAMPAIPREVGRRLASLNQGGLPIDIAEAVTFMASPLAAGVNGRTLRVCGQNYMGA
ncbi:MAG: 3-oxoacyl-ACP reductase [Hydrocarboniphaga sp.]|uniref:3-oxoacyl-ACP reductase n=1 Tax=Hydrocarboniphaga sp. TaxID=2033016 RepID=UPI00260DCC75|nr:3-oxoacyl-ACP reductase [Hydrocarboniphaga sp.]MDB5969491.1 3-oxoacyl-ACP reductase [Hydrocarboniphaga sp.]